MYNLDINQYMKDIKTHFKDKEDHKKIEELFNSIVFKLEKNSFHYNNIENFIPHIDEKSNFYQLMPIYFEIESLFISLRSSVDMILHLINFTVDLKIPSKEVILGKIYHSKIPRTLKDVFNRYTRKRNNPIWEFIYTFRNEFVHDKSIFQTLKLEVKEIEDQTFLFTKIKNVDKDIMDLFKECFKFLSGFIGKILSTLEIYLKAKVYNN